MTQLKKHKRILLVVVPVVTCLILLVSFGALPVGAQVSVTVTPSTVAYGIVALGTSNTASQQLTVTNNSGVTTENFSIKSSDATRGSGTTWELVTGTPSNSEFKHESSLNGTDWTPMPANNDYITLATDIAPGNSVTVYLRISMPGSTIDYLEHTITITILASE